MLPLEVPELAAIVLRPVEADDCRLLWEWANDASVRATSFNPMPIPWQDHVTWFDRKVGDEACRLSIALDPAGTPVGQVRLEVTGRSAVISISVAREHRGKGYSSAMIRRACRIAVTAGTVDLVVALIRPDNEASRRAFRAAGFVDDGDDIVKGFPAVRMVFHR
jgi:RimJ/RimL family protein N-acetyltransferase